jgi:hypothetical protein
MEVRTRRAWIPGLLALAGGCALVAATFMAWYTGVGIEGAYFNRAISAPAYAGVFSSWGGGQDAWEAFAGLDVALAVFAALSAGVALGALGLLPAGVHRLVCLATAIGGVGVGAWTLERVFDRPELIGLGPGAVIGFAAIAVATIGAFLGLARGAAGADSGLP